MKSSATYYAYLIPATGARGVCAAWAECEKKVKGVTGARYRGFKTRSEAEAWLGEGAAYVSKSARRAALAPGIYFDAGTGRGNGVEISVTDERGQDLLAFVMPKSNINRHGKHLIPCEATNNFGELLACKYALKLALKRGVKKVFGDSRLIVDHWSKGHIKKEDVAAKTVRLAAEVSKLRAEFEKTGGALARVSGNDNPADLGFHR